MDTIASLVLKGRRQGDAAVMPSHQCAVALEERFIRPSLPHKLVET
ncbi:hypothetical protein [Candidatus Amarolinea dominans]